MEWITSAMPLAVVRGFTSPWMVNHRASLDVASEAPISIAYLA
jgi:hypothetical protein